MFKSRYQHVFVRVLSTLRNLLYTLLLALLIGGVSQSAPVSAAALKDKVQYTLTVYGPDPPICVGSADNSIRVRLISDTGLEGQKAANGVLGVKIEGFSGDESIGIISPPSRSPFDAGEDDDYLLGSVYFNFEAKKAGTTTVYFETSILGQYVEKSKTIKVVNCKYEVTMNASDTDSREGVTIWTSGNVEIEIKGDGGTLTGTGNFEFASGLSGLDDCSVSYSEFDNPTTITGEVDDNGQLTLQFAYEPGQITENASCPEGGGSFSQEIDLTNTGVLSATFPEDGGTQAIRFTYAGSDMAPGTMIINVEPVPEEAGA